MKIATRKSKLALWQANHVKTWIEKNHPQLPVTLVEMITEGDQNQKDALQDIGGKFVFVKKLQIALLENQADIAVHSIKDMSCHSEKNLHLAAVCVREDARDVMISNRYKTLSELPKNAVVGTSSPRRKSILLSQRPDLNVTLLRGNVDTRIQKLDDGQYDAIIVAAAGVKRLGLLSRVAYFFPVEMMTPAIGQGAIGVECRADDEKIKKLLLPLHDASTGFCVEAERAVNRVLRGDCHTALGAHAVIVQNQLQLRAIVASEDGKKIITASHVGDRHHATQIGERVAKQLLALGAEKILSCSK